MIVSPISGIIKEIKTFENKYHKVIISGPVHNYSFFSPISGYINDLYFEQMQYERVEQNKTIYTFFPNAAGSVELTFDNEEGIEITTLINIHKPRSFNEIEFQVDVDDYVVQGQPIGEMLYDALVILFIPWNYTINMKKNETVKGGKTIIAI
tara:strand:- start:565 stop:1020 length:456 start_codon:yes stop_codon:yes gene_type:complete